MTCKVANAARCRRAAKAQAKSRPMSIKDPKFCEQARAAILDINWGWQTRVVKDRHGAAPKSKRKYKRVKLRLIGDSEHV